MDNIQKLGPAIGRALNPTPAMEAADKVLTKIATASLVAEILDSHRPFAFVPAWDRDEAKQIAVAARDGGFGVSVIVDRSERLLVLVVADPGQERHLRRFVFVRRYNAEIATDRHVKIETVYCPASWLTGLAHSQDADIGPTL